MSVKDSFTRMNLAWEAEKRKHQDEQEAKAERARQLRAKRVKVKSDLFALFTESDRHTEARSSKARSTGFFATYEILVREAFTLQTEGSPLR